MHRFSGKTRAISQFAAAALIAAGGQLSLQAEEHLQLRVPQSFSSAAPEPAMGHPIATELAQPNGELEVIRERYPDGKVKIERQVTLDADGNYVNHGPWKLYSPSEVIVAEGQFEMGKRVGSWTRWLGKSDSPVFNQTPFNRFQPPFASQATFTNGVMDGDWLVVDADNKKMLQISLSEGQRNGLVLYYTINGKPFYQASYDHGVPVGEVMEADSKTGELQHVATYVDGRRIVTKTAHFKQTARSRDRKRNRPAEEPKKSEEVFLAATTVAKTADNFWNVTLAEYETQGKDLRHGPSRNWFESGMRQVEGYYQHDKRAGTFTYWYSNGQIAATGEFTNDLPNGVWVWWHENGQKAAVGKYRDGALIDDWRWWNENGKLALEKTYTGHEATAATPKQVLDLGKGPAESKEVAARQASDEQSR